MSMAITGSTQVGHMHAMSGASGRMSMDQKLSSAFDKMSGNTGSLTAQQFAQSLQTGNAPTSFKSMGANAIFSQLDTAGTGSISKQDFVNGMKSIIAQSRHSMSNNSPQVQTLSSSINSLNELSTKNKSNTNYFA